MPIWILNLICFCLVKIISTRVVSLLVLSSYKLERVVLNLITYKVKVIADLNLLKFKALQNVYNYKKKTLILQITK